MNYHEELKTLGVPSATIEVFIKWHTQRPEVWRHFEATTLDLISQGFTHYGAKAIMEVIRWKISIEHKSEFKICNDYTAYYARIFTIKYPQYKNFFEFREITGLKKAA